MEGVRGCENEDRNITYREILRKRKKQRMHVKEIESEREVEIAKMKNREQNLN
jgi:hypothetical protein